MLLRSRLRFATVFAFLFVAGPSPAAAQSSAVQHSTLLPGATAGERPRCVGWKHDSPQRNPTANELRCYFGIRGPGRFGLLWYEDVPAYQPATPLPGTHVVGVAGMPGPRPGESYEAWEWRVLRTEYGPETRRVYRGLDVLEPEFANRVFELEERLRAEGIGFSRRETWRDPERQAYLFQQGRSRPGALVTATLTSWHNTVDARGRPAARAVDFDIARGGMRRFHELIEEVGLRSFGGDSNDPGHVYLPDPNALTPLYTALLRLLPLVPVVTLATGRPFDEYTPAERRAEWRSAAREFAREPYFPRPVAEVQPPPLTVPSVVGLGATPRPAQIARRR
jgi:hypothetical protein